MYSNYSIGGIIIIINKHMLSTFKKKNVLILYPIPFSPLHINKVIQQIKEKRDLKKRIFSRDLRSKKKRNNTGQYFSKTIRSDNLGTKIYSRTHFFENVQVSDPCQARVSLPPVMSMSTDQC